jgi:hypothetical protein
LLECCKSTYTWRGQVCDKVVVFPLVLPMMPKLFNSIKKRKRYGMFDVRGFSV